MESILNITLDLSAITHAFHLFNHDLHDSFIVLNPDHPLCKA